MADKLNNKLIITLYLTVLFILVSLKGVYELTYKWFGKMAGSNNQIEYGSGMMLSNRGLIIHAVVFALLVFLPMHFGKEM